MGTKIQKVDSNLDFVGRHTTLETSHVDFTHTYCTEQKPAVDPFTAIDDFGEGFLKALCYPLDPRKEFLPNFWAQKALVLRGTRGSESNPLESLKQHCLEVLGSKSLAIAVDELLSRKCPLTETNYPLTETNYMALNIEFLALYEPVLEKYQRRRKSVKPEIPEGVQLLRRFAALVHDSLHKLDVGTLLEQCTESVDPTIFLWLDPNAKNVVTERLPLFSRKEEDPKAALQMWQHVPSVSALYFQAPSVLEKQTLGPLMYALGCDWGGFDEGPFSPEENPDDEGSLDDEESSASGGKSSPEKDTKRLAVSRALESLTAKGEIETFISKKGHVTDWHQDFQENFTIQLQGVKRWRVKKGSVKEPVLGLTPHYFSGENLSTKRNELKMHLSCQGRSPPTKSAETSRHTAYRPDDSWFADDCQELILWPGDVFFFPSGLWHQVETVSGEPSISINFSLQPKRWADELGDMIRGAFLQNEILRSKMCGLFCESEEDGGGSGEQGPVIKEVLDAAKKVLNQVVLQIPKELRLSERNQKIDLDLEVESRIRIESDAAITDLARGFYFSSFCQIVGTLEPGKYELLYAFGESAQSEKARIVVAARAGGLPSRVLNWLLKEQANGHATSYFTDFPVCGSEIDALKKVALFLFTKKVLIWKKT